MIYIEKEFKTKTGLIVKLKSPSVDDAEMLLESIKQAASQTDYLIGTPQDFNFSVENEKMFIKSFVEDDGVLICGYVDGKIVGNCSINTNNHIKDRHRCTVGIALNKPYWDKGIGTIMFEEMIKIAQNNPRFEQMELDVIKDNKPAIHLYQKMGFEITGEIPRQLKLSDGTYLDGINMVKYLK